ncbi:hypothetical protein PQX77_002275 [Marasmius sp. AFHP31]|nr:hypothetical protein PQX77_002275 [Marasmius sp. AFHP31]
MFNHSNSPRISVSGGSLSFNVVHGNQSNSHTQSPQERHRFPPGEEWKEELYREYERTPTGRIKLINTISETGVARRAYEESRPTPWLEGSDTSGAKRVLHLACTVRGTRESPPFLAVKYTGRDARRAFKMDVLRFSQLKDPVFPQLRGFSDSEIPVIIFHDLLIPATHAIQHAQSSPEILCYLRLQGETAVSNLLYEWHQLDPFKPAEKFMEDGRTRLTISNHCIGFGSLNFIFFQKQTPYNYDKAWLCQAIHVFHGLGIPREEWESFALLRDGSIWLLLSTFNHQSRRDYDYRFDPPYYLFVLPPPQLPSTTPDVVSWTRAPAESLYYWSVDPQGNSRMSEAQHTALGLPCFHKSDAPLATDCWKAEIYDLVRQWQVAKGFDPTTSDFARSMGHPIVEILPQDNDRFDTCVDVENGESTGPRREQGPEPMQVDEASFETIPNSRDPSSPRHVSEGSTSVDVDMEDCSDRMADLRVEAMLMDE